MKVQLWSVYFDPEPMGIAPLAGVLARGLKGRGHEVEVVSAHPHYPTPLWGRSPLKPYRERVDGISVLRLPLFVQRRKPWERLLYEASFTASLSAAAPFLGRPDAMISASPSFPALLPAMSVARFRKIPWYIWLQDILPDGAVSTGYLEGGSTAVRLSRRLERAAYEVATGLVVLSESFRENLLSKGVDDAKITVAYNPATITGPSLYGPDAEAPPRVLCMGNIGKSQGLPEIVRDFEGNRELEELGARLVIAGGGVAEEDVRAAITTDRVEMTGVLDLDAIRGELSRATLAAVTQSYDGGEFNVPSKLMNYLAAGVPVIASVRPTSEASRIVQASESGWLAPPGEFGTTIARALTDRDELRRRSENGHHFATENLTGDALAARFERVLTGREGRPAAP